jgi:hypothetical protein
LKNPVDHFRVRAGEEIARTLDTDLGHAMPCKKARSTGEAIMARYEIADVESAALGQANASADMFFELGIMYSTGRSVPTDLVSAHKWFNIAAMRGNRDAARYRSELAAEMSELDIAAAQRAARDWLTKH